VENKLNQGLNKMDKETAYLDFVGKTTSEDDNGWTKEVWEAAWQAAIDSLKEKSTS
jgi:hypothetical protein